MSLAEPNGWDVDVRVSDRESVASDKGDRDVFRERVRRKVDDWRGCYRSIVVPRQGKFTIFQRG